MIMRPGMRGVARLGHRDIPLRITEGPPALAAVAIRTATGELCCDNAEHDDPEKVGATRARVKPSASLLAGRAVTRATSASSFAISPS
jgi:hypothetical protein